MEAVLKHKLAATELTTRIDSAGPLAIIKVTLQIHEVSQ